MRKRYASVVGLLLAMAAITVPASASAYEWTMGGTSLKETVKVEFQGGVLVALAEGEIECELGMTLTAAPVGGKSVISQAWMNVMKKCVMGGVLKKCEVESFKPLGLPWEVVLLANDFDIKAVEVEYVLKNTAACPNKPAVKPKWALMTAKSPFQNNIPNVSISGTGESNYGTATLPSEFEGKPINVLDEPGEGEGTLGIK